MAADTQGAGSCPSSLSEVGLPRAADVQPSWGLLLCPCSVAGREQPWAPVGLPVKMPPGSRVSSVLGRRDSGRPNVAPPARQPGALAPRCRSSRERGEGGAAGFPEGAGLPLF